MTYHEEVKFILEDHREAPIAFSASLPLEGLKAQRRLRRLLCDLVRRSWRLLLALCDDDPLFVPDLLPLEDLDLLEELPDLLPDLLPLPDLLALAHWPDLLLFCSCWFGDGEPGKIE